MKNFIFGALAIVMASCGAVVPASADHICYPIEEILSVRLNEGMKIFVYDEEDTKRIMDGMISKIGNPPFDVNDLESIIVSVNSDYVFVNYVIDGKTCNQSNFSTEGWEKFKDEFLNDPEA